MAIKVLDEGQALLSIHQIEALVVVLIFMAVMMVYLLAIYYINSHQRRKKTEFKRYITHRFEEEDPHLMIQAYLMHEQEGN